MKSVINHVVEVSRVSQAVISSISSISSMSMSMSMNISISISISGAHSAAEDADRGE